MAFSVGEDPIGDGLFIGGILFAVWGAATWVGSGPGRTDLHRAVESSA